MRAKLLGMIGLGVALLAHPAGAQDTADGADLQRVMILLSNRLAQDPDNRLVRYRFAQAAYRSGRSEVALYHLKVLMRSSESPAELARYQEGYATVVNKSPWSFNVNFSLLPSTNINKSSFNDYFDTLLGKFEITNGGEEETGVGLRVGGTLSYATALDNGLLATFSLDVNRFWYPVERFNRYDTQASLALGWHALGSYTEVKPYVSRVFYNDPDGNYTRYGVRLNHERYLSADAALYGSLVAEYRDHDTKDYLDGPVYMASLSYKDVFAESFTGRIGANLTYSQPEQEHLRYAGTTLWGEVSRTFDDFGTIGVNASVGGRWYEGIFPALTEAREDHMAGIGVSFSTPHLEILDMRPKFSCNHSMNWSNVALYEFKSTDCSINFERSF
jgi:hypothetical protein